MSVLIIIDQAPYGNWSGREALDMALSLAAFDQPVSLLFVGAGINWLRKQQNPAPIQQKGVNRNLAGATVFGIEELLADQDALQRYGLGAEDLLDGVAITHYDQDLLANYLHVVCQ
ncbi:DsrE family protein [Marinobacter sp. SS21]|uniref:DsrE family protein n=1 Tax=Marinobacter sp. SS21 TaxID=2979460 RepID=UPI00232D0772|nr:DsrE family protein [Marinobacter sp. SS21]MDC0661830.1 DsrE family protein [Marinobacter sp. SS21]